MVGEIEITRMEVSTMEPNEVRIHYTLKNGEDRTVIPDIRVWFNGEVVRDFGAGRHKPGMVSSTGYDDPIKGVPISEGLNLGEGKAADVEVCIEVVEADFVD